MKKKEPSIEERIMEILNSENPDRDEISRILYNEQNRFKIPESCSLYYCNCGYPLGYKIEEIDYKNESSYRYVLLSEILKYEANIDKFCTYTYCPKCNRLLEEVRH